MKDKDEGLKDFLKKIEMKFKKEVYEDDYLGWHNRKTMNHFTNILTSVIEEELNSHLEQKENTK